MKTWRNGSSASKYRLNITIRLTQSVMISRAFVSPVTDWVARNSHNEFIATWSEGRRAAAAMADLLAKLLEHKAAGNAAYQQKEYDDAVAAYSKGVKLLPYLDDEDDDVGKTVADLPPRAPQYRVNFCLCCTCGQDEVDVV